MNDVALIHEAKANDTGDRRGDAAVGQLKIDVGDLAFIDLHRRLGLIDQRLLRVALLFGDGTPGIGVALEVGGGVVVEGLVFRQLPLGLDELHLKRTGINFRQQVVLVHQLSFDERDFVQLPIHAGVERHGIQCGDGTKAREIPFHIPTAGRGRDNRRFADGRWAAGLGILGRDAVVMRVIVISPTSDGGENQQPNPPEIFFRIGFDRDRLWHPFKFRHGSTFGFHAVHDSYTWIIAHATGTDTGDSF